MDTPGLGIGAPSSELLAWHVAFCDVLASRDIDRYVNFLSDDCILQINNAMPVYSKRAIKAAYEVYLQGFRTVTYEHLAIIGTMRQSAAETLFTYGCNDGSTELVQCTYVADFNDAGLVTAMRVYGDDRRVFKPFMRAND